MPHGSIALPSMSPADTAPPAHAPVLLAPILALARDDAAFAARLRNALGITDLELAARAGLEPERRALLLDTTLQHLGGEGAGVRLAWGMPFQALGQVGLFLVGAPELRELLTDLHRYWPLMQLGERRLQIGIGEATVRIGFAEEPTAGLAPGQRLAEELAVGVLLRLLREVIGPGALQPQLLAPIGSASFGEWQRLFEIEPTACDRLGLALPVAALDRPLRGASPALRAALRAQLEAQLALRHGGDSPAQRVVQALSRHPAPATVNLEDIASALGVSPVVLGNQLRLAQSDFEALRDSLLRERVLHELVAGEASLDRLAAVIGLQDTAELDRRCRRWFEVDAARLRAEALACGFDARRGGAWQIEQLPPAPQTCRALMALRYMEEANLDKVVEVVETDPVLSARVLGLAGSAYYGARKVRDLKDAIGRVLGFDELIRVATMLVARQALAPQDCPGFDLLALWTRSLASGHALAELLANTPAGRDGELLRLLGLFHELGLQALAHRAGPRLATLLRELHPSLDEASLRQEELRRLGTTRHLTGALLLARWGLPAEMVRALRQLDQLLADPTAPVPSAVMVLAVLSRLFRLRHAGLAIEHELLALSGLLERLGAACAPDALAARLDAILEARQQQAEALLLA